MASTTSKPSNRGRGALASIAPQAVAFPVTEAPFSLCTLGKPGGHGPDIANARQSPAAAVQQQGLRASVRDSAQPVPLFTSVLSISPATLSSPLSDSDDAHSDASSIFSHDDEPLPAYDAPLSPASSIGTSPADSFLALKGRTAAPLLSPPYTHEPTNPLEEASLLGEIFPTPTSAVHGLPTTQVEVADLIGEGWKGVVVNDAAAGLRTLYVHGGKIDELEMREAVVDLVDRAEEQWAVNGVVLALDKETADLGSLVHGLTYVGFTALSKPEANPSLLLLALDLV